MNISQSGKVFFAHQELACPSTGQVSLAPQFEKDLLELRITFDHPMTVTSCCRSASHNAAIGGHPHSLHVYDRSHHPTRGTAAIDIAWPDSATQKTNLLRLALALGWSVGVARGFLHLDRRDIVGLPQTPFGYGG